jgi:hypothetical protein
MGEMESWCELHQAFARQTSEGVKWVVKTRDRGTGQGWLFRFAYDAKPDAEVLRNLDAGRKCDPVLDQHLNYVRDTGRELSVWRPTTRKYAWLIRESGDAAEVRRELA